MSIANSNNITTKHLRWPPQDVSVNAMFDISIRNCTNQRFQRLRLRDGVDALNARSSLLLLPFAQGHATKLMELLS